MTDLSEKERRSKWKYWREAQKWCRAKRQKLLETPPPSPETDPVLSDTSEEPKTTGEIKWESKDMIGQWCVVKYDDIFYPGTIVKVNETHAKVTCIHKVGKNRFFWPNLLMMSSEPSHIQPR